MAAPAIGSSNSGFYMSPVTKCLIGSVVASSCAFHATPLLMSSTSSILKSPLIYSFNDIIYRRQIWRIFTSKLGFLDVKDLICCCLLLYYFRIFERRFGSRKYASYLLNNLFVSSLIELALIYSIRCLTGTTINFLPSGPIGLVFSLFVNFFHDIHSTSSTSLLGISFSGKGLTYAIGAQIIISSRGSLISAVSGIISGIIFNFILPHRYWLIRVPESVAKFTSKMFRWFESEEPDDGPFLLGATIEIQRQQNAELIEQQVMMSSVQEMYRRDHNSSRRSPAGPVRSESSSAASSPRVFRRQPEVPPSVGPSSSSNRSSPYNMHQPFNLPAAPGSSGPSDASSSSPHTVYRRRQLPEPLSSFHPRDADIYDDLPTQNAPFTSFGSSSSSGVRSSNGQVLIQDADDDILLDQGVEDALMAEAMVRVEEEQIQTLVEMGFDRNQVIQALRRSNNDLNSATNILLSDNS